MLLDSVVARDGDFAEVGEGDYDGDVLISLRMRDRGCEEKLIAFDLVEDKAFENSRLTIVIIQTTCKRSLGKGLGTEHTAILTNDLQHNAIIGKSCELSLMPENSTAEKCSKSLSGTPPLYAVNIPRYTSVTESF